MHASERGGARTHSAFTARCVCVQMSSVAVPTCCELLVAAHHNYLMLLRDDCLQDVIVVLLPLPHRAAANDSPSSMGIRCVDS